MTDLIILLLITSAVAWCADHVVFRTADILNRRRMVLCTVIIILLLAGFAGLRTRCNDTYAYKHAYEIITEDSWDISNKSIGANPLFNWINYQLKMHDVSTQNFLMFWAFLTVGCYIVFSHRYSVNYPLTIFLLFTTGCYTFAFAGIKQAAAVAIAVAGVMFALKKKWIPFVICVLLASCIHPYALLYLLTPLMCFKPWSNKTYLLLGAAILCGLFLRPLIGTVVSITALMGEEYTVSSFTEDGVNIVRVIVCNVPTVLSFLYRRRMFAESTREENLMVNFTMLNGAIMFIGLFGTANYFARLANYFLIFQAISLPWMLKKIGGRDGQILKWLMITGYIGYFLYANVIAIPFDQDFARLTVSEYILQLGW